MGTFGPPIKLMTCKLYFYDNCKHYEELLSHLNATSIYPCCLSKYLQSSHNNISKSNLISPVCPAQISGQGKSKHANMHYCALF